MWLALQPAKIPPETQTLYSKHIPSFYWPWDVVIILLCFKAASCFCNFPVSFWRVFGGKPILVGQYRLILTTVHIQAMFSCLIVTPVPVSFLQ